MSGGRAGSSTPAQEKLFRKFRGGDGGALNELLEGERLTLYDYLMRMTGQVSRSADTVDEVYQSLSDDMMEELETYTDLRVLLYTTARKFNADIWNAETSRLANAALEAPVDPADVSERVIQDRQAFKALDKALRSLPGRERETLALRERSNFALPELAEIMGVSEGDADALHARALATVEQQAAVALESYADMAAALFAMPAHPPPLRSSQATMNLSVVMQGIKAKPVGLRSPLRIALVIIVIAVAVAYYFKPEWFP